MTFKSVRRSLSKLYRVSDFAHYRVQAVGCKFVMNLSILVFMWDLYKRWASPRKKLTKIAHETSSLDYSIPSFKVPGVSGALIPLEFHDDWMCGSVTKLQIKWLERPKISSKTGKIDILVAFQVLFSKF
eukprot:sb/3475240/